MNSTLLHCLFEFRLFLMTDLGLMPNANEPVWGNITKYSDGRFSPSRKRLSASSLSHIARYALSFTYKITLPIWHKSPHRNY